LIIWLWPSLVWAGCGPKHDQMLYTSVIVAVSGGTGSGTVIHSAAKADVWSTLVLTNFHVIGGAVSLSEEWDPKKGEKVEKERRQLVTIKWVDYNACSKAIGTRGKSAEIVAYDKPADLALLRLVDRENGVANVALLFPESGTMHLMDEVWAVGAGLGEPPFATRGELGGTDHQIQGYRYLFATAPIIFGNSGGGLFRYSIDRKRFELIGVPSKMRAAGFQAVSHMGFHIPIETVREFLRANSFEKILK
tara:strand:- start:1104 stop:1850 length:747 start_codon:yes stop_codon:yes gene_type:complete